MSSNFYAHYKFLEYNNHKQGKGNKCYRWVELHTVLTRPRVEFFLWFHLMLMYLITTTLRIYLAKHTFHLGHFFRKQVLEFILGSQLPSIHVQDVEAAQQALIPNLTSDCVRTSFGIISTNCHTALSLHMLSISVDRLQFSVNLCDVATSNQAPTYSLATQAVCWIFPTAVM